MDEQSLRAPATARQSGSTTDDTLERAQLEVDLEALLARLPRRRYAHPSEAAQRARLRAALRDLRGVRVSLAALRRRVERLTPRCVRHPQRTTWTHHEVTA